MDRLIYTKHFKIPGHLKRGMDDYTRALFHRLSQNLDPGSGWPTLTGLALVAMAIRNYRRLMVEIYKHKRPVCPELRKELIASVKTILQETEHLVYYDDVRMELRSIKEAYPIF